MRALPIAAVVAGLLLLTACQPERHSGDAAPAGSAYPQSSASTPPTATLPTTTPTLQIVAVLGPNGFGELKLGMTRRQAEATGLVANVDPKADSGCHTTDLRGGSSVSGTVFFDGASGVVAIDARGADVKTPEGLQVGSPGADVRRTYPKWESLTDPGTDTGRGYVVAPGSNDKTEYNISVGNGKVTQVMLQVRPHHCYE